MAAEPWNLELTKPRSGADPGTGYIQVAKGRSLGTGKPTVSEVTTPEMLEILPSSD